MKRIIMLAGIGGTGKSTYANKLNLEGKVEIVSSDEIRLSLTGSYDKMLKDMSVVYKTMIENANELLKNNEDITIILDSTFLDDNRRNFFLDRLKGYDTLDLIMLKVHDSSIIFKRNKLRAKEKWIPEDVLSDMIKRYSYPSEEYINRYTSISEVYVDEGVNS